MLMVVKKILMIKDWKFRLDFILPLLYNIKMDDWNILNSENLIHLSLTDESLMDETARRMK